MHVAHAHVWQHWNGNLRTWSSVSSRVSQLKNPPECIFTFGTPLATLAKSISYQDHCTMSGDLEDLSVQQWMRALDMMHSLK